MLFQRGQSVVLFPYSRDLSGGGFFFFFFFLNCFYNRGFQSKPPLFGLPRSLHTEFPRSPPPPPFDKKHKNPYRNLIAMGQPEEELKGVLCVTNSNEPLQKGPSVSFHIFSTRFIYNSHKFIAICNKIRTSCIIKDVHDDVYHLLITFDDDDVFFAQWPFSIKKRRKKICWMVLAKYELRVVWTRRWSLFFIFKWTAQDLEKEEERGSLFRSFPHLVKSNYLNIIGTFSSSSSSPPPVLSDRRGHVWPAPDSFSPSLTPFVIICYWWPWRTPSMTFAWRLQVRTLRNGQIIALASPRHALIKSFSFNPFTSVSSSMM